MGDYNILTILGPTATGKTSLATALAAQLNGEIISADSRQIYRGMDIGTGKDLCDYIVDGKEIPYHLIDIAGAGYKYNLYEYQHDFLAAYRDIVSRNRLPILCGGTGLYIEAVLKGYRMMEVPVNESLRKELEQKTLEELTEILKGYQNFRMHNKTDVDTPKRAIRSIEIADYYADHEDVAVDYPILKPFIIGIDINREYRRESISARLKARMEEGMVDEVKRILSEGVKPDDLIYYGLEYKFVTQYIIGELTYDEMLSKLEIAIHQFAKRQMTWFRGMERRGFTIHWIDGHKDLRGRLEEVFRLLDANELA